MAQGPVSAVCHFTARFLGFLSRLEVLESLESDLGHRIISLSSQGGPVIAHGPRDVKWALALAMTDTTADQSARVAAAETSRSGWSLLCE